MSGAGRPAAPARVLVVGASRGIGLALARQYRAAGAAVTVTARSDAALATLGALGARALRLDVADATGAAALAWPIDGETFDTVIVNAGVFGPRQGALAAPSQDEFDTVMRTNVLGAMRVLQQVAESLAPGAVVAVISSRMGSIGARASGSAWLYRASKAALNSVLRDAAFALQGRAVCVTLHPGWVRTDMGGADADLSPDDSAAAIRRLLAGLTPADHGRFLDHDGTPIPW
jgi:NAD(P)-dependent dehydrogenase (short-subunit alcohol dehydrogenase family)